MKACTVCKEVKALAEFNNDRTRRDGKFPQCRKCVSEQRRRPPRRLVTASAAECGSCGQTLPHSAFSRNGDRLRSYCKACAAAKKRAWDRDSAEKRREYQRQWRADNGDAWAEYMRRYMRRYTRTTKGKAASRSGQARRRARRQSLDCGCASALAIEVVTAGTACVYCGDPAEHLEHVIALAAGGWHCLANLVPACKRCNSVKGARPVEYLVERLRDLGVDPLVSDADEALADALPCPFDLIDEPA